MSLAGFRTTYLEEFIRSAFPRAGVRRCVYDDHWEVTLTVNPMELMADRDSALRKIAAAIRPKFVPRRKLWWGRKK